MSSRPNTPRFLVTAGNTREKIDSVRDWGNIFTGNTGFDIAKVLASHGEVDLLTSNREHLLAIRAGLDLPHAITASAFDSHAALEGAMSALMSRARYDAVFMTAAVADYKPAGVYSVNRRTQLENGDEEWIVSNVQAGKVKSNHKAIAVLGEPTEKLVDKFRTAWQHRGLLFKFKLEVGVSREELIRIGQASRVASGAEYLVANSLEMVQGEAPGALILSEGGHEWVARSALAGRLGELAMKRA